VVVGHFSVESYHSIAVSLALVDRAKLHCLVSPGYQIHTINHPLPRQSETVVMDKVSSARRRRYVTYLLLESASPTKGFFPSLGGLRPITTAAAFEAAD